MNQSTHDRTTLAHSLWLACMLAPLTFGCSDRAAQEHSEPLRGDRASMAVAPSSDIVVPFTDVTSSSGLDFVHSPHLTGDYFMPEIMGAGVGLIDYDRDGDLDVYLVQGAPFEPALAVTDGKVSGETESDPRLFSDQLFKNQWIETGRLEFVNVTEGVGIRAHGYGMGVAIGDFDADGVDDILVTNYGANQLWRNHGDGHFEDVSIEAGLTGADWSSSAAFLDIDNDQDLDLYVVNYVAFSTSQNFQCTSESGQRDYCGPDTYTPVPDQLYINQGDGRFRQSADAYGLRRVYGPGLGIAVSDFDNNGFSDVYVANDGAANQLWMNNGQGFKDNGLMSGTSLNGAGVAEAGMGVMAGDFDKDGDDDLFMTHLIAETNTLYLNDGKGQFYDATSQVNLASGSLPMTGFGAGWLDYNSDTYLDLFVANGNVKLEPSRAGKSSYPFEQPNQLFRNTYKDSGRFEFVEVSDHAPDVFAQLEVSRGAAFGDLNNDGAVDVVLTNNNGPARVLQNNQPPGRWFGIGLSHPDHWAVEGAVVALIAGSRTLDQRTVRRSGSYLSAHDDRVQLLSSTQDPGATEQDEFVQVTWPDGSVEAWPAPVPGRYHRLEYGTGNRSSANPGWSND